MRALRRGMLGEDVRYLQYFLGIKAGGSFGVATETAVKNKQRQMAQQTKLILQQKRLN